MMHNNTVAFSVEIIASIPKLKFMLPLQKYTSTHSSLENINGMYSKN
jgi:hypothetical protein